MKISVTQLILAGIFVIVSARAAEAAVIASAMSPPGLALTGLLALALGWRLSLRRQTTP